MNTLKLYSMLKVNQKKAKETKYNHTRIIMAISATIIAILCLASCATDKSKYHFDSSKDALVSYHVYLSELQKTQSLSSEDFVTAISNWSELRDSVYTYISKDSAFYAHTYLSSEFYCIHDSIRTEMFRLAVGQDRTLKDVLRVKKSTSQYNKEEDIRTTFNSAKAFYASLDSLEVFKADKGQTLVLYRRFFSEISDAEFKTLNDLKSVIRTEDRLFRTFLTHINEYSDISLADITKGTERLCKSVYEYATDGELDAIGSSSRFGDNMLTLSAGLSVTIGKVGHKRIIDAKPYMSQNEWLLDYANGLSSRNRYLTKRVHEDEQCMAEYRKILEIEGLLDLYKNRLTDKGHTKMKSLYPKNDYSGLNSLRARLANRGWDGNPNTMPRAMQKRNGVEDTEDIYSLDSLLNNSGVSDNDYLNAILNGQEYIGAPIYFFFHLGTDVLTEKNQVMNLDEIARIANKHGLQVKVIGAADSATGTESINDNLSRQRAEYIRRLLLDRGIDDSRIYTIYAGGIDKYSPAEANRNTCVVLSF